MARPTNERFPQSAGRRLRYSNSMNRRDLLAGLAVASVEAGAQTHTAGAAAESLYIPKPQRMEDRRFLHDFMDEFAFVDLVTVSPSLRITHIPVWLDRAAGVYGTIHGHISRQNPQSEAFDGRQSGVVVFRGPHGYISPTWYAKTDNVAPTWNFAVVHATGKLRPVKGTKELNELLSKLVAKFESHEGTNYDFAGIDESYKNNMMSGVIGFELEIELLEGKFKLGQDRSPADRQSLLKKLGDAKAPRSLREFTASFYERQSKA
jgi:transcriptional regulator